MKIQKNCVLQDIIFVSELAYNLLSVSQITELEKKLFGLLIIHVKSKIGTMSF